MSTIDEAIGYYTYRSFLNRPVGAPNDILWGEGELFLLISDEGNVTGTLAFPAEAGGGQKDFMDLAGTVTAWDKLAFRFVGKGRAGSAIADYEYEYDCRVAHEWDSWTEDKRLDFVLEWSIREDRLHSLRKICERGEMSPEQRARFAQLETVVARNRAAIDRLLDE